MKLAELNPKKTYFVYTREHWIGASYSKSYYKVAQDLRRHRYQFVTDTEGNLRRSGSMVLVTRGEGIHSEWVTLKSIREEFYTAVALITKHNQDYFSEDRKRGVQYARHMQRKAQRAREEIEKPIKDNFMKAIKSVYSNAWGETKLNHLPIDAMLAITIAINSQPNQIRKAS